MKRLAAVLCVALFGTVVACGAAYGQALDPADRDRVAKYLEATEKGILNATKGLSEAQWNFKPAPDRWSVAQVLEHIAASEDFLFAMVTDKIMKAPPRAEPADVKAIDEMILTRIVDRSKKAQAPEQLQPTNRFGSPDAAKKHFEESRAKTAAFLQSTPDLRAHAVDSQLGAKVDAYEWILFIAAHSERHTKQINEVKADPNFPKQ